MSTVCDSRLPRRDIYICNIKIFTHIPPPMHSTEHIKGRVQLYRFMFMKHTMPEHSGTSL